MSRQRPSEKSKMDFLRQLLMVGPDGEAEKAEADALWKAGHAWRDEMRGLFVDPIIRKAGLALYDALARKDHLPRVPIPGRRSLPWRRVAPALLEKHGFTTAEIGEFTEAVEDGKDPDEIEAAIENVKSESRAKRKKLSDTGGKALATAKAHLRRVEDPKWEEEWASRVRSQPEALREQFLWDLSDALKQMGIRWREGKC